MIFWVIAIAAVCFVIAVLSQHTPHATDHPVRCRHCGTSHPSFARFCRQCGKRLD
jgi:hypothetical protein